MVSTGDRIKALIAEADLTQAELAERIGVEATKLSKSLNGVRRFPSLELALVADEFGVSVDWLLSGEEPAIAAAARAAPGSSTERALALAHDYATLRSDLTAFGYRQDWRLPRVDRWARRWIDQGLDLAAATLPELRSVGWLSGGDLAEAVHLAFGIDVAVQDLGAGFDGLAVATESARLILVSSSPIAARQRFTMAHELGHLLASDDQQIHRDSDIYSAASKQGESEVRANAFAAALLMPEDDLRARLASGPLADREFCEIATTFKVSPSALAYRLENLGMVDSQTRSRLGSLSGKRAAQLSDRSSEFATASAESMLRKPPASLLRDSFAAYLDGAATIRSYARLLGADPAVLREQLVHVEQEED